MRFEGTAAYVADKDLMVAVIKRSLVRAALAQFYEIREVPGPKKKPSTSEALDWIRLLVADDIDPVSLRDI